MSAFPRSIVLALGLFVAVATQPAVADIELEISNGAIVDGTIADEGVDRFLVSLPEGAKLVASVKGIKPKGGTAPGMTLRVLDDFDTVVSDGLVKQKSTSAKVKIVSDFSTVYVIEVTRASGPNGNYQLKAKWKSPSSAKIKDELFFADDVTFADFFADRGAVLSISVKGAGSSARPIFSSLEGDEFQVDIPPPADASKGHKLKNLLFDDFGDGCLTISNTAGDGKIAGKIKIKSKPAKVRIDLRDTVLQPTDGPKAAVGKIITPGGELVEADDEDIVGDIVGSSVDVPAGALRTPSPIFIGSSTTIDPALPPGEEQQGAGPSVFFGPEGIEFELDVTVTIPFDADRFGADPSALQVFTRDADGNIELVPGPYDIDVDFGTVSFPVSHFSSFQVFVPLRVGGDVDLNGDGIDDLILPAPDANGLAGRVYVFFGGPPANDAGVGLADRVINGAGAGDTFGKEYAVGDVTGDGQADLIVNSDENPDGTCHVFAGGAGFGGPLSTDDTFTIEGAIGEGGFNSVAVGDVNGDGEADILIGAEAGNTGTGAAFVFFGGTGQTDRTTANADATFTGEAADDLFGASIAHGDVNDDGTTDLIVGADEVDNIGETGKVYVFFGGTGFADVAGASASAIISGAIADGGFGIGVASGDVTGDGIDDLVVSELPEDIAADGAVYVFTGSSTFATSTTAGAARTFNGDTDELLGATFVLQDIIGDSTLDLVLGAPGAELEDGAVFIVAGGPTLLSGGTSAGTAIITGPGSFEGFPLFGLPIVQNGLAVLTTFAPLNEDGGIGSGRAYVFLGVPVAGSLANDANVILTGQLDDVLGGDPD